MCRDCANFLCGGAPAQFTQNIGECSANRGLPLPLGRGACETKTGLYPYGPYPWRGACVTKSKKGRARDRKSLMHRVYSAQSEIETMVSDHGLGRGQTMG